MEVNECPQCGINIGASLAKIALEHKLTSTDTILVRCATCRVLVNARPIVVFETEIIDEH